MKKILFKVNGGVGKNIMSTSVLQQFHKKHPDVVIYVQASYPKIFSNLSFIEKVFGMEPVAYFYEIIKDCEILNVEPYENLDYERGKVHLVEAWCKLLQLPAPDKMNGVLKLNEQEKQIGRSFFMSLRSDRPVVAVQITGGTSHYQPQAAYDPTRVKQTRDLDIEIAQEVVDKLIQKGNAVLQIRLPTEPALRNTYQLPDNQVTNIRHLIAIINECAGCISIDSMLQHIWAALDKPSKAIVLWGGTNPTNLGYASNNNLTCKDACDTIHCNRPSTYRMDILGDGELWHCPLDGKCMKSFKADYIVENYLGTQIASVPK